MAKQTNSTYTGSKFRLKAPHNGGRKKLTFWEARSREIQAMFKYGCGSTKSYLNFVR